MPARVANLNHLGIDQPGPPGFSDYTLGLPFMLGAYLNVFLFNVFKIKGGGLFGIFLGSVVSASVLSYLLTLLIPKPLKFRK